MCLRESLNTSSPRKLGSSNPGILDGLDYSLRLPFGPPFGRSTRYALGLASLKELPYDVLGLVRQSLEKPLGNGGET
jgi:hypothetical protein